MALSSFSPEDSIRHWMYEDVARALAAGLLKEYGNLPVPINRRPIVLDFGSQWYGDVDGGWRTHMRTMLKELLGRDRFDHVLATYPEYDIQVLHQVTYGSIDILVADQVLEHVPKPWKAAPAIAKAVRPGGFAMVATPGFYPVHPSPLDCWRIFHDGYKVLFPSHLWNTLTLSAWGSAERVAFEYGQNGAYPYGPPTTTVEQAMAQPAYTPVYDGRCPLMFWWVGQRTIASIRGDEW